LSSPSFLHKNKGLIIAADVTTRDDLLQLVNLTLNVPQVVAIKVGFSLTLRLGLPGTVELIRELSDLPIIYDHQKAGTDIPSMANPFAEACAEAGVSAVIVFPLAGPKTLDSFIKAALENELIPVIGITMTHQAFLQSEGGFIDDNAARLIGKIALDLGVQNFVLPGNKPQKVQAVCTEILTTCTPLHIMMPGIGTQGGQITEAFRAVGKHYPFAIIGSSIYKASNPRNALTKFAAEVENGQ